MSNFFSLETTVFPSVLPEKAANEKGRGGGAFLAKAAPSRNFSDLPTPHPNFWLNYSSTALPVILQSQQLRRGGWFDLSVVETVSNKSLV